VRDDASLILQEYSPKIIKIQVYIVFDVRIVSISKFYIKYSTRMKIIMALMPQGCSVNKPQFYLNSDVDVGAPVAYFLWPCIFQSMKQLAQLVHKSKSTLWSGGAC